MKDSFDLTLAYWEYVGEQAEFDGLQVVMAVYQELAEFSKSAGKDQQSAFCRSHQGVGEYLENKSSRGIPSKALVLEGA